MPERFEQSAGVPVRVFLARLIWLCLLPLLLLAAWLAFDSVVTGEMQRDHEAEGLARSYAISVDQRLNAQIRGLKMLAASPRVDDPRRWPDLYRDAQRFQENFGSHVIFADAGSPARMLFNTRVPFGTELPPMPKPEGNSAAPTALATGRPAVGDSFIGPVSKERLVAIAVPVLRGDRAAYLLVATPEAHQFQGRLDQLALPAGWAMSVVDGKGEAIARRQPAGIDSARDVRPDGRFVVPSEIAPWSVVVEIPHHVHRAPLYAAGIALGLGLLAATLAGVLGGKLAGRRLTRAVDALIVSPDSQAPLPDIAELRDARLRLDDAVARLSGSEARFRRLFQNAPVAMGHVRGDGVIVALNARFSKLFGYDLGDLRTIDDWWRLAYPDPDYSAQVVAGWGAAVQQADTTGGDIEPNEYRVSCRDGSQRIVQISGIRVEDGVLAAFVDVTDRRRVEAQLRLWAEAFEHAELGLAISDARSNKLLDVNPAFARRCGYRREALRGQPITVVFPEELRVAVMKRVVEIESHGVFETEHLCKDGRRFPILLDLTVLRGADGAQTHRIAYALDLTERRRAEAALRELNEEMEQLMRRQVARQTVAAIAHQLNQPLMALAMYGDVALRLLRGGNPQPERLALTLENSAREVQRAGDVVRELMSVVRQGDETTEAADLNDMVRTVVARVAAERPGEFQTRLDLDAGPPAVRANRLQLEKVLAILVENGVDAMRDAGVPPAAAVLTVCSRCDGSTAQLTVSDQGPGIDPQSLPRLFEPFFTTKLKGLGMGLPIARSIVELHGGRLWCESVPGSGASFHLTLPVAP